MSDAIAELKAALAKATDAGELAKSWVQSASATSGLTAYSLEAPAKTLFPVLTPLRNIIPRVGGGTGIQANWRAVTAINTNNMDAGVSEGNRGGVIAETTADYLAAFKGIGQENYVTFEADYAAQGFDDVKARATMNLLSSLMIEEEKLILGGNNSMLMGATPTPTVATQTTGGTFTDSTLYSVICVALGYRAQQRDTVASGITASITRTNADGSTDTFGGCVAQKSAAGTVTTGSPGTNLNKLTATVTAVRGAMAYAWYVGTPGSERIYSITTINSVSITTPPTTGQLASALPATDNSTNTYVFDGILTQTIKSGTNGYWAAQATGTAGTGTPLTAGTDGTITEFDTLLQYQYDTLRLSPDKIWVSSQEANYLRKKILTGSASAMQRFMIQVADQGSMRGGTKILGYVNPFTTGAAEYIPIEIHPYMPPGTVLFTTSKLPYALSNVVNVLQIRTRKEYYQLEWPMRSRKYEYGVYADEVLQNYFPPSFGVISNIAAG